MQVLQDSHVASYVGPQSTTQTITNRIYQQLLQSYQLLSICATMLIKVLCLNHKMW